MVIVIIIICIGYRILKLLMNVVLSSVVVRRVIRGSRVVIGKLREVGIGFIWVFSLIGFLSSLL